jgi:WD40 repeat protein
VAFSPDSKTLASGDAENTIRLWDVTTHRQISVPLTGHTGEVTSLGFSPDGKTLASAGQDGTIRLWDVQTRRELGGSLTGHTGSVQTVAFSPNGRTLASGSVDGTVRLWTTDPIGTYINQLCGYIDVRQAQELWQQANLGIPYQRPC